LLRLKAVLHIVLKVPKSMPILHRSDNQMHE
jgi:hypothetical protein